MKKKYTFSPEISALLAFYLIDQQGNVLISEVNRKLRQISNFVLQKSAKCVMHLFSILLTPISVDKTQCN